MTRMYTPEGHEVYVIENLANGRYLANPVLEIESEFGTDEVEGLPQIYNKLYDKRPSPKEHPQAAQLAAQLEDLKTKVDEARADLKAAEEGRKKVMGLPRADELQLLFDVAAGRKVYVAQPYSWEVKEYPTDWTKTEGYHRTEDVPAISYRSVDNKTGGYTFQIVMHRYRDGSGNAPPSEIHIFPTRQEAEAYMRDVLLPAAVEVYADKTEGYQIEHLQKGLDRFGLSYPENLIAFLEKRKAGQIESYNKQIAEMQARLAAIEAIPTIQSPKKDAQ